MELLDFIKSHDDWEALLTADPYNLKISRKDGFIMFKYNQITSDFSYPLVQQARGIIFNESNWDIVCRPFDKFFNYGESNAAQLDWENGVRITSKIDGSLIKVWKYQDVIHISTNGAIDAFSVQAYDGITFGEMVDDLIGGINKFANCIAEGFTYMFELVSPFTRIVIPYPYTALYYLSTRHNASGEEFFDTVKLLRIQSQVFFDIKTPTELMHINTLDDVIQAANKLDWDKEGYVVTDSHGKRVKVKSPAYIEAHYGRKNNQITTRDLIKIVMDNEIDEFLTYANDYKPRLYRIINIFAKLKAEAEKYCQKIDNTNFTTEIDKIEYIKLMPARIRGYIFKYTRNNNYQWDDYLHNMTMSSLERLIKQEGV